VDELADGLVDELVDELADGLVDELVDKLVITGLEDDAIVLVCAFVGSEDEVEEPICAVVSSVWKDVLMKLVVSTDVDSCDSTHGGKVVASSHIVGSLTHFCLLWCLTGVINFAVNTYFN
jgi:hypothetical protein